MDGFFWTSDWPLVIVFLIVFGTIAVVFN